MRILSYIDDFLVAPATGRASNASDCLDASREISRLMRTLGLARHEKKGVFGEVSKIVECVGFV